MEDISQTTWSAGGDLKSSGTAAPIKSEGTPVAAPTPAPSPTPVPTPTPAPNPKVEASKPEIKPDLTIVPKSEVKSEVKPEIKEAGKIPDVDKRYIDLHDSYLKQKNELEQLKAKIAEMESKTKIHENALLNGNILDKGVIEEQNALKITQNEQIQKRNDELDTFMELSKMNPKYQDIDEVLSDGNMEWLVSSLAQSFLNEQGGNLDEWITAVWKNIYAKKNPFPYLYELMKESHPSYIKPPDPEPEIEPPAPEIKPSAPLVAPSIKGSLPAPTSVASLSGGGGSMEGWTRAYIASLPIDDAARLRETRPDVWKAYMNGTLA